MGMGRVERVTCSVLAYRYGTVPYSALHSKRSLVGGGGLA